MNIPYITIHAGIIRTGVVRAGFIRTGVVCAGVVRAGVVCTGVVRAGVIRVGVVRAGGSLQSESHIKLERSWKEGHVKIIHTYYMH